jgi:hypothetical protein
MTPAATSPHITVPPRSVLVIALIVLIVALWFIGRRIGDTVPMFLCLGTSAFSTFVLSRVPGTPTHCLVTHPDCTQQQIGGVVLCSFVIPLCLWAIYKMLRGDKRGANGNWRRAKRNV